MPNHDKVKRVTEQEAVLIFALPEVAECAAQVAAYFRDADTIAAESDDLRRQAAVKRLDVDALRRTVDAALQAEGRLVRHAEANELATDATELLLQAALRANDSERKNVKGERAWAELATKFGAYIPHGRRLEFRSAEHPGKVLCYDCDEHEVALHDENLCPSGTLHHDPNVKMLRRKQGRKFALWPGRKD